MGTVHNLADFYNAHAGAIFRYLYRLCGDRDLADELTGETFYQAMLALDGLRGEASTRTWLLPIARNLYLRHCRRAERVSSLEGLEERGRPFAAAGPGPEAI